MTDAPRGGLDGVLAHFEMFGGGIVSTRALDRLAPADARAALHAAGIVKVAAAMPTWPCDVRGCSREVRSNYDGARKPLVAVCSQAPPACMPVELGFDEVAQQELSVDALVVATCALLGATVDRAALAKVRERHATGTHRPPVLVAATTTPRRDIAWAASPRDMDLSAWCARRERAERATLVVVPTTKNVALELLDRFARGEVVEIRALTEMVEVRDGTLALADAPPPLLPVARAPASSPPPAGIAAILGVKRWEEIRITAVDAHTLSIEANGKKLLRTFVELGFVDARRRKSVAPTSPWTLLVLFCNQGRIKPSAYREIGEAFGAKKAIERIGVAMREAFGLADHPLKSYSKTGRLWEARFRVSQEAAAAASDVPDASLTEKKRPGRRRTER